MLDILEDRRLLSGGIAEFPTPTPNSFPYGITAVSNGLFFTENSASRIGYITVGGNVTEPVVLHGNHDNSVPSGITTDIDGNLWFTETYANSIGELTNSGDLVETTIQTSNTFPQAITFGPRNNLWFNQTLIDSSNCMIGTIDPVTHLITEVATRLQSTSGPKEIVTGPDGNIWSSDGFGAIVRVTPDGIITPFPILASSALSGGFTVGPDGNLWFAEAYGDKIASINPNLPDDQIPGSLREFSTPTLNSHPQGIVVGPDGNLWFTETSTNKIGRIDTTGTFLSEYPIPHPNTVPLDITMGPDGNLWFTEERGEVGKLYVLTSSGLSLGPVVNAGQELDAVVANFHDDEPGMVGGNYHVSIDWGDGMSGGQAWNDGGGNWVATGSHTYANPGHYDITVTIADVHAATGMTTTAYSSVDVGLGTTPGGHGYRTVGHVSADLGTGLARLLRGDTLIAPVAPSVSLLRGLTPPAQVMARDGTRASEPASALVPANDDLAAAVATRRPDTVADPLAWQLVELMG